MTALEADAYFERQQNRAAALLQSCWRRKVAVRQYEQRRKVCHAPFSSVAFFRQKS